MHAGGVLQGAFMDYATVKKLSDMPTRSELMQKIARLIRKVCSCLLSSSLRPQQGHSHDLSLLTQPWLGTRAAAAAACLLSQRHCPVRQVACAVPLLTIHRQQVCMHRCRPARQQPGSLNNVAALNLDKTNLIESHELV